MSSIWINFGYRGPCSYNGGYHNGGIDVRVVDLVFENAKMKICVHIPKTVNPRQINELPFCCHRYEEVKNKGYSINCPIIIKETHPETLQVTMEQIRNLKLVAGLYEEVENKRMIFKDSFGNVTYEKGALRTDCPVALEIPENLENDNDYVLVVTSQNQASLSAHLVRKTLL